MELKLPQDFKDFLKLLNANRVKYLVVGGYAVGFFGYPRATKDLDIWIAMEAENAKNVIKAVHDFGFPEEQISEDILLKPDSIIRMGVPPVRIEIITKASGVIFDDCFEKRSIINIEGTEVPFINLNDLKKNKKAAGRHKDLDDLENLP